MGPTRRRFFEIASAAGLAATALAGDAPAAMPRRALGKTGILVPILGFGSGSRFLMYKDEDRALEALNRAIDLGVNYIDTAHSYGDGKSEERIGRIMPARRNDVVLATKLSARKADDARRQIELSLKRLKTDRLDVLHIHALAGPDDLAAIERPDGVLKALLEARDQKTARAIGITSHASPAALRDALDRHDFDCAQFALNAAKARMADDPKGLRSEPLASGSFEDLVLPVTTRKGQGVIAMKVFGQDQLGRSIPVEAMLRYSLSLPVSMASCGMPRLEMLEENARLARAFRPLSEAERRGLNRSISEGRKAAFAEFLGQHADT